jgi:hypothetical protein
VVKSENTQKRVKNNEVDINTQSNFSFQARKKVEPWVPVNIPTRDKKIDMDSFQVPVKDTNCNK